MKFSKKLAWIIPAIIMSTTIFAETTDLADCCDPCPPPPPECDPCYEASQNKPYDQGYEICEGTLPKAYNAPGRIDICDGVDAYVTGSFIYWEALGDQLDLGIFHIATLTPNEYRVVKFSTEYEPGFKVGLGTHFEHDDWDLYAEYTRIHMSKGTSATPPTISSSDNFYLSWLVFDDLSPNTYTLNNITGNIDATWSKNLDKFDLELGRSYYLGRKLIARPYVGGSAHWLDQSYTIAFTYISMPRTATYKNDSWAVGIRPGLNLQWIFVGGFRAFSNAAFNLMYAQNKVDGTGTINLTDQTFLRYKKHIVRDVEELVLGLAWGSYFCDDKWHMDFSVAYETQRYSHVNYMTKYAQMLEPDTQVSQVDYSSNLVKPGDIYFHGLTVTARFDF